MSLIDKWSEEIQSNLFEVNHALIQNKYLTSITATNMLLWYCGKGEIRVQNKPPWAQPNEVEGPIPLINSNQIHRWEPENKGRLLKKSEERAILRRNWVGHLDQKTKY